MTPDKKKTINGHKVEQFYWGGKDVVYIDHRATQLKYDDIGPDEVEQELAKHRN